MNVAVRRRMHYLLAIRMRPVFWRWCPVARHRLGVTAVESSEDAGDIRRGSNRTHGHGPRGRGGKSKEMLAQRGVVPPMSTVPRVDIGDGRLLTVTRVTLHHCS